MRLATLIGGLVSAIIDANHQSHHAILSQLDFESKRNRTIGDVDVPGIALTPAEVLAPTEVGLDTTVGVKADRHNELKICRGTNLRIRVRFKTTPTPEAVARLRVAAERTIDHHG